MLRTFTWLTGCRFCFQEAINTAIATAICCSAQQDTYASEVTYCQCTSYSHASIEHCIMMPRDAADSGHFVCRVPVLILTGSESCCRSCGGTFHSQYCVENFNIYMSTQLHSERLHDAILGPCRQSPRQRKLPQSSCTALSLCGSNSSRSTIPRFLCTVTQRQVHTSCPLNVPVLVPSLHNPTCNRCLQLNPDKHAHLQGQK